MLFVTLLEIPGKVNLDTYPHIYLCLYIAHHQYADLAPRLFEQHLETLLMWANTAIDKTTNQPMLPHAFLIINAFAVEVQGKKTEPPSLNLLLTLLRATLHQGLISKNVGCP